MYPNTCEQCGSADVTVMLASWHDHKFRCRVCYDALNEQEQRRLRQVIRDNSEAMRQIEMQRLAKRGQAG